MKKYRGLLQLVALAVIIGLTPFAERLMDSVGGFATIMAVLGIAYLLAAMGQTQRGEGRRC